MNIVAFIISALLAVSLAPILRLLAVRWRVLDRPETAPERKLQSRPVPLLGGGVIYIAWLCGVIFFLNYLVSGYLLPKHLGGVLLAGGLIMLGGYLDDRFRLSPLRQLLFPIAAVVVTIAAGIGVNVITNPFGGFLHLDLWAITLFTIGDTPFRLLPIADAFTLFWLLGMMYTTKLLDGLDGLVSGLGVIGSFVIFLLSTSSSVGQPETGLLALLFAGACAGFLVWNFYPAKIYLGEGGSLLAGYVLGVLAIISGAKIATALLVFGLPALDVAVVIIRRLARGESPFRTADRQHLHFQLLRRGLSQRLAVFLFYAFSAGFGAVGFLTHGKSKVALLAALLVAAFFIYIWLGKKGKNH